MKKIKIENNIVKDIIDFDNLLSEFQEQHRVMLYKNDISDKVINNIKSKPKEKITFTESIKLSLRERIDNELNNILSNYNDYKELVVIPYTEEYDKDLYSLIPQYKELSNKVEQTFIVELDKQKVKIKIAELRKVLSDTDYIIIKAYEAKLSLIDPPYSSEYLNDIVNKRQEVRNKINSLELLLK